MNFRQYMRNFDIEISPINIKKLGESEDYSEEIISEEESLFDGYLGEQKEAPNPLDYGPNATYRNLREGVVYKKGQDNLWETFVKDGQPGKQGNSGSGLGVQEATRLIISTVNSMQLSGVSSSATDWSNILGPVFNTTYISGTPQTAELVISAGVSQRVAIPQGTHTKFKFTGYGPFRYRLGTSAAVAVSTDIYADPGDVIVNEKLTNTHLAVYGVSYGNVYVEGGSI